MQGARIYKPIDILRPNQGIHRGLSLSEPKPEARKASVPLDVCQQLSINYPSRREGKSAWMMIPCLAFSSASLLRLAFLSSKRPGSYPYSRFCWRPPTCSFMLGRTLLVSELRVHSLPYLVWSVSSSVGSLEFFKAYSTRFSDFIAPPVYRLISLCQDIFSSEALVTSPSYIFLKLIYIFPGPFRSTACFRYTWDSLMSASYPIFQPFPRRLSTLPGLRLPRTWSLGFL